MLNIFRALLTLFITGLLAPAFALEGETIIFDPASGNYLITYLSSRDEQFHQITFIPATKINPTIKTKLKQVREKEIYYSYTLTSGQDSQQVIRRFLLKPVSSVTTSMPDTPLNAPPGQIAVDMLNTANYFDSPALWQAGMGYSEDGKAFRVGWYYNFKTGGLTPGEKATFGIKSRDLPGIIQAEVYGYAPGSQKIPGEETQDDEDGGFGQQYTELVFRHNFVPRPAAAPTLSVTAPFNGIKVLEQLKAHIATWPSMKLIDAATETTIGAGLQSSIGALRDGNNQAAINSLRSIRHELNQMLSKGKLAANGRNTAQDQDGLAKNHKDHKAAEANHNLVEDVLGFNLKYIAHALGSDAKDDNVDER